MRSFFVFDVESVGLHGEGFAVGGGIYLENGAAQSEFRFVCDAAEAMADSPESKYWVETNVPVMEVTHRSPEGVRSAFWEQWIAAKKAGAVMAADCAWPVEARFLMACIKDNFKERAQDGPYPLIEISSLLLAAGKDPIGTFSRTESELPKHDPLADARQSARLLAEALQELNSPSDVPERKTQSLPV